MSALLDHPTPVVTRELDPRLTGGGPRRGRNRVLEWVRANAPTIWWLTPVVLAAALVSVVNFAASPAYSGAETSAATRAWTLLHLGRLAPNAYAWDEPPLGTLQLAAWAGLTGGFARQTDVVVVAREAMILATLLSVVLLWFVVRRLGLGRAAAGIATIVFALSPLAIDIHRAAYLDNVAMPWLLLALLLAQSRRHQLVGVVGSAVALGVATLTQETFVLAVPLVGYLAWRSAHRGTRRYALTVAGAVYAVILAGYVMVAVLEGQLVSTGGAPSLVNGFAAQFGGAGLSSASAVIANTVGAWFRFDPVLVIIAIPVAIGALFLLRVRPFAVALLALTAVDLAFGLGGYLPSSAGALLLPLAAVVIAGIVDRIVRTFRDRDIPAWIRGLAIVAAVVVALAVLVPTWLSPYRTLISQNVQGTATQNADDWVAHNIPKDSRLIVDESMWVDLVRSGFPTSNVVLFPALQDDPAVKAQSPHGWKDSDYVVSTEPMRTATQDSQARAAITNSVVVASFGTSTGRIQVRRIVPAGAAQAKSEARQAEEVRAGLGTELNSNSAVLDSPAIANSFGSGRVDPRIPLLIAQLAVTGEVTIARLPVVSGENGQPIREVVLSRVDGSALSTGTALTSAGRAVRASLGGGIQSTKAVHDGLLIEYPITLPAGVIQ